MGRVLQAVVQVRVWARGRPRVRVDTLSRVDVYNDFFENARAWLRSYWLVQWLGL